MEDCSSSTRCRWTTRRWHESGRALFERLYHNLDYDKTEAKTAKQGRRWINLDRGGSGVFMLDRFTGRIYLIKSKYGVPNLKKCVGTLASVRFD